MPTLEQIVDVYKKVFVKWVNNESLSYHELMLFCSYRDGNYNEMIEHYNKISRVEKEGE
jgi:hypothetical protein